MRRWGLPPAVGRFPGVPRPLGGHAEVFLPPHHLRWGGSLASPAGWEGMREFPSLASASKSRAARHTETLHFSLFTILFFRPKPGEGEKQRHTHLIFRDARELLPRKGDFIASVRGLRASGVWAFLA